MAPATRRPPHRASATQPARRPTTEDLLSRLRNKDGGERHARRHGPSKGRAFAVAFLALGLAVAVVRFSELLANLGAMQTGAVSGESSDLGGLESPFVEAHFLAAAVAALLLWCGAAVAPFRDHARLGLSIGKAGCWLAAADAALVMTVSRSGWIANTAILAAPLLLLALMAWTDAHEVHAHPAAEHEAEADGEEPREP